MRSRLVTSLPWPLPALLTWSACWALFVAAAPLLPLALAAVAACLLGAVVASRQASRWRQLITALGFPLSAVALLGAASVPPWAWLLAGVALFVAYPLRTWRDAPFFPTARDALDGLHDLVPLPERASVHDAGCGAGDGLLALARVWPRARLSGVEWSRPLAWVAARRCATATIRRGDLWAEDWGAHDLVYLFQRPESMPRAWAKACAQMRPGAWLVSLEFPVEGVRPVATLARPGQRKAWVYQPVPRA